jgi:UMP-CMP kinase
MTIAEPTTAMAEPQAATTAATASVPTKTADGATNGVKHYQVAFVLGGPGSGKGTQSAKLVEEFGVVHLSAGDLLRAHMKSGTPDGQMVADMIANGQIVPSSVTVSLLKEAMDASGKAQFLIDGFPRNEENRGAFESQTGIQPKFILFFDCPEDVMEKRLLSRNEGRTDDNIETIRKRFRVFIESSMPVIEYYEKEGKVARITADRDPEEIYKEVRRNFVEFMV